jgi:hypothetical protein
MKSASLNIGTKITFMQYIDKGCAVSTHKFSEFEALISDVDALAFEGLAKPAKFAKYEALILANGFTVVSVEYNGNAGFEGANADVISFCITYKKA